MLVEVDEICEIEANAVVIVSLTYPNYLACSDRPGADRNYGAHITHEVAVHYMSQRLHRRYDHISPSTFVGLLLISSCVLYRNATYNDSTDRHLWSTIICQF